MGVFRLGWGRAMVWLEFATTIWWFNVFQVVKVECYAAIIIIAAYDAMPMYLGVIKFHIRLCAYALAVGVVPLAACFTFCAFVRPFDRIVACATGVP